MSCRYKNQCPSYSGWCEGPKRDFSECVSFLITAYEDSKEKLSRYQDVNLTIDDANSLNIISRYLLHNRKTGMADVIFRVQKEVAKMTGVKR